MCQKDRPLGRVPEMAGEPGFERLWSPRWWHYALGCGGWMPTEYSQGETVTVHRGIYPSSPLSWYRRVSPCTQNILHSGGR
jgi:hypothetical protein